MIEGESPVRVRRNFPGPSIEELAHRAKVDADELRLIENGQRYDNKRTMKRIAAALNLEPDDLEWSARETEPLPDRVPGGSGSCGSRKPPVIVLQVHPARVTQRRSASLLTGLRSSRPARHRSRAIGQFYSPEFVSSG